MTLKRGPDGTFFGHVLGTLTEHAMPMMTNPMQFDKYDLIDLYPTVEQYLKDSTGFETLVATKDYKIIKPVTRTLKESFRIIGFNPHITTYESIFFVVECGITTVPHSTTPAIVQALLWRNARPPGFDVIDFTLKFTMSKTKAIMSDKLQTPQGREFWFRLTDKAYSKKYHVYISNPNELLDISDKPTYIRDNVATIWGKSVDSQDISVVISKTKISPR